MPESELFYLLVVFNVALYAAMIFGYMTIRKQPALRITSLREAFEFLERRLKRAFPDLRDGFTWNEAITRMKPLYGNVDWVEVGGVFQKYEAYRYGGVEPGDVQIEPIVKLAMKLPRGVRK